MQVGSPQSAGGPPPAVATRFICLSKSESKGPKRQQTPRVLFKKIIAPLKERTILSSRRTTVAKNVHIPKRVVEDRKYKKDTICTSTIHVGARSALRAESIAELQEIGEHESYVFSFQAILTVADDRDDRHGLTNNQQL